MPRDPDRRTPPRFVPTLTEVVGPPAAASRVPDPTARPERPEGMPLPESARREPPAAPARAALREADLADVVTRLIVRSDFQDKLAQAVATVVAQQVHAQLSGQVASLCAQLPELVERSVQNAITEALRKG